MIDVRHADVARTFSMFHPFALPSKRSVTLITITLIRQLFLQLVVFMECVTHSLH
jgi:hypothetical protein